MRLRCNTCGGEYQTVQADGMAYFHQCPPLRGQKVSDGAGGFKIVPYDPRRDPATVIEEVPVTRRGARNENPDPKRRDAQDRPLPIAEGTGVTDAPAAAVPLEGFTDAAGTGTALATR